VSETIQLKGRIFLNFEIELGSGLHIGGSDEGISIGGVDKTVIRDPITNQPYIPGSSLRGKIRSLTEKYTGAVQNNRIGDRVKIHSCGAEAKTKEEKEEAAAAYKECDICQVFGVPGERDFSSPTRLIVRDVPLTPRSAEDLNRLRTDLPYTEIKIEVAINRITSAASPRQMERVPAGAIFGPAELVYSLYDQNGSGSSGDLTRFKTVVTGLQLLEDDYLGGLGSRGSGQVLLKNIKVGVKSQKSYDKITWVHAGASEKGYVDLAGLVGDFEAMKKRIDTALRDQEG
jgi:CRISPR-associated protein Csm3